MTWHSLPDCSAEEYASSLEPRAAIVRYRNEWATDMRIEPGTSRRNGKGAGDTWIHFTKETITVARICVFKNIYLATVVHTHSVGNCNYNLVYVESALQFFHVGNCAYTRLQLTRLHTYT